MYVNVEVNVDPDQVLKELSTEQLAAIIAKRTKGEEEYPGRLLEAIYLEFRRRGDAPKCLRDYIYEILGRIL